MESVPLGRGGITTFSGNMVLECNGCSGYAEIYSSEEWLSTGDEVFQVDREEKTQNERRRPALFDRMLLDANSSPSDMEPLKDLLPGLTLRGAVVLHLETYPANPLEPTGQARLLWDREEAELGLMLCSDQNGNDQWVFPADLDQEYGIWGSPEVALGVGSHELEFDYEQATGLTIQVALRFFSWPRELVKLIQERGPKVLHKAVQEFEPQPQLLYNLPMQALPKFTGLRSLVLFHGTCSNSEHSFGRTKLMEELPSGRDVFAYDHPTLTLDPLNNASQFVREFLDLQRARGWDEQAPLELDLVGYSRGGLVARCVEYLAKLGAPLQIGSIIMIGPPSFGTGLATTEHMTKLVGQFTTMLSVSASAAHVLGLGFVAPVLDAMRQLLNWLRIIYQLGTRYLPGLECMSRRSLFLTELNARDPIPEVSHFAVSSTFHSRSILARRWLGAAHGHVDHDVIVPEEGCWYPLPRFQGPWNWINEKEQIRGITHFNLCSSHRVAETVQRWLS